ncbi:copper fist DNA binding domain protein [Pseudozyma hubeiensis SY62]|uniref:Copper fist DNA binding domain protein n=1 Tax=Pseudozyma hubeiensis (strain SY62) TaxID=1305764 RepID=R9NY18_PSEHS|nr:copper fist DNA binding domain protein [Pseudozyma hubeiensis SY62]GAC93531.1 copper fist DNA binding domain protein [Pseudozyma hubeiensis SY62]
MTAATASASAPSRLFSHRYSESTVSPPRIRESYHTQSLSPSSSSSNIRDAAAQAMSFSASSPSTDTPSQLDTPARRFSHGDASAENSNVKYACASCIRGHRTSSCNHKDGSKGPLYPIRSKGRPPTQCEICRKKRRESGRHVRCDCTGKKTSSTTAPAPSDNKSAAAKSNVPILPRIAAEDDDPRPVKRAKTQTKSTASAHRDDEVEQADHALSTSFAHDNVLPPILAHHSPHSWSLPSIHTAHPYPSRVSQSPPIQDSVPTRYSTLSLSSLMNPCGCRSTGSCTCCSEPRQRRVAALSPKQVDCGLEDGCDPSQCSCSGGSCRQRKRSVDVQKDAAAAGSTSSTEKSACCSGKSTSKAAAPSIELLLQAVDMSTEFVPPACGCGDNCRCARCVAKQDSEHRSGSNRASSMTSSSPSPRTPPAVMQAAAPGCDDCAACDLTLERPSGIGAVDRWMEDQRESVHPAAASASDVGGPKRIPGASSGSVAVPTLHGGLLSDSSGEGEEMRAELVLVHPKCEACLEVVRSKGVGVLSRSE